MCSLIQQLQPADDCNNFNPLQSSLENARCVKPQPLFQYFFLQHTVYIHIKGPGLTYARHFTFNVEKIYQGEISVDAVSLRDMVSFRLWDLRETNGKPVVMQSVTWPMKREIPIGMREREGAWRCDLNHPVRTCSQGRGKPLWEVGRHRELDRVIKYHHRQETGETLILT